jgi:hypothetical protein
VHDKYNTKCRRCNSTYYKCAHDIEKYDCPTCSPHLFCDHKLRRSKCPQCSTRVCPHTDGEAVRNIFDCEICSPTAKRRESTRCPHRSSKYRCQTCSPHLFCEHNVRTRECPQCTTRGCAHAANVYNCPTCVPWSPTKSRPGRRCAHKSSKYECIRCSPHLFCECRMLRRRCGIHRPINV